MFARNYSNQTRVKMRLLCETKVCLLETLLPPFSASCLRISQGCLLVRLDSRWLSWANLYQLDSELISVKIAEALGRLAQLVRAPSSHGGGRWFESCVAHFCPSPPKISRDNFFFCSGNSAVVVRLDSLIASTSSPRLWSVYTFSGPVVFPDFLLEFFPTV